MSYIYHGSDGDLKMNSPTNERECYIPLGTAGGDALKRPMVEVIIPLMPDSVFEGIDFEDSAAFMSTSIRLISVAFYECRIA